MYEVEVQVEEKTMILNPMKKQSFAAHGFVAVERQVEFMLDSQALERLELLGAGAHWTDGQKPATPTASDGLPRGPVCWEGVNC
ncbi:hypothetical protein N7449_009183 [Penicillium cf. viridicatum]|uniref:Uncharacterized protein n=1 Tax=Penicillium cf. viridicatum TaxID=2972119 RepID=A0A9W9JBU2_9EURO|nr:hypothetical protein N7449_009183 [Penicillium cf. viridicatum]